MILTLVWLVYVLNNYSVINQRPHELFAPINYFGALFMPSFPSPPIYYSVGLIALLLTLSILFYKDHFLMRIILSFCLLWLHTLKWSFGFQSSAAHIFMLSHIFSIFIPFYSIFKERANEQILKSIQWVYLGVLLTYTYSGIWKWIGLGYKLIIQSEDANWLSPHGPLYNAIIEYRQNDLIFKHAWIFQYQLFWQVSFLTMSFILTFCSFAAFRQQLRVWVGIALIIFHLVNSLVFNINFYNAPLVLACLFFPYDLIFKNIKNNLTSITERQFYGKKFNARYIRIYSNGNKDVFNGFYAYREQIYDQKPLIGGIYYTPFLDITVHAIWRIINSVNKRKKSRLQNS
jgi:hypothetical protein